MTLLPLRTSMHVCQNKSVPVLVRLQTNIPNYSQVKMQALETPSFDQENTPWHVSKHFMNPRSKQTSDHHFVFFLQSDHSNSLIGFYLMTGALERPTFTAGTGTDSKDSSFCVGANYDRAWPYVLSLQHPPTLWVRSEGSSVSIAGLHCTAQGRFTPGQEFQTNSKQKKIKNHERHCFWFDPKVEHMWQQVCMACSFLLPVWIFMSKRHQMYTHYQTGLNANTWLNI